VTGQRILIAEDDPQLGDAVQRGLREEGFEARLAPTAALLLEFVERESPDGLIIDIGLPDADGRDLCHALRARGITAPVVFLTARDALPDRLSGFAAGGDDYLSKPFHVDELLARVSALARRKEAAPVGRRAQTHLDPLTHSLVSSSGTYSLTPTEYRLLAALMGSPGQILRRRALISAAWPAGAIVSDNTLDQYVARLRRKLGEADDTRSIVTAHGVGYQFI